MSTSDAPAPSARQRRWAIAKRVLVAAFLALVVFLLVRHASTVDWEEVGKALRETDPLLLAATAGLSLLSYGVYCMFDLMGRHYTGHHVPVWRTCMTSLVCYAFTINLGALVGGVGLRYRLYGRAGLKPATVSRIMMLAVFTNWSGYLLLGGALFAAGLVPTPEGWFIGDIGLRVIGAAMVATALAYLGVCAFARRRTWHVRGHAVEWPGTRMALLQLGLSTANWMLMGFIVWLLLGREPQYLPVLGVLLIAAIAGTAVHVPAGLGVLEAVFIALLGGQVPSHELLAALFAYRGVYYLAPLCLAALAYLVLELRHRHGRDPEAEPART
ncbi:lysylphosphatidylglycerol synthase domain-containing protein [Coralloluteibacterium stylophorae]|uniref:UPF0104 family protein n=1 Tax=Coralloluteibacterium stylophorae TaxID=1776034 RepID=A0A8J8B0J0_9GAMM|nr:lysylphosphatidylglycerol synthase domain-containing protein [Coralloluteibacterium stylophorae]MBS7456496.1 UPF0104 family protein [Coralloluteibacterium stylophorae]